MLLSHDISPIYLPTIQLATTAPKYPDLYGLHGWQAPDTVIPLTTASFVDDGKGMFAI